MKLHLAVNSGFIQKFAEITKAIDLTNEHFFIVYGEQMTGQIIDTNNLNDNFLKVGKLEETQKKVSIFFDKITTIHIHFLSNEVIKFLNHFNISNKKIVWYFWGADAYSLPEVYTKIKQFRTDYLREFLGKIKQTIKPLTSDTTKLSFIKKIDFVAHYSVDDFSLIKPLLKPTATFKYFTYGAIEYVLDFEATQKGNDILLGNSASSNNHHIYTLNKLLSSNLKQKIYCPLSYGGSKSYVSKVINVGKKKFGNNFIALTELIDTDTYHKEILTKADVALMPHNRSQAWGNVMQLLWQGSKVFMFPSNNLYKFLQQKGFEVFELTKKTCKEFGAIKVNAEHNKNLLQQHFSLSNLSPNYKEVLSL